MSAPAGDYLALSKALNELIDAQPVEDREHCAYLAARAALLRIRAEHGEAVAARFARDLARELAGVSL